LEENMAQNENNFFLLYCATGMVYVRWACASILSLIENGDWDGDIGIVVSSKQEENIVSNLFPDLWCYRVDVEIPENAAKTIFKPLALQKIPRKLMSEYQNILHFDVDVYVHSEMKRFLERIEGHFWVDKIYREEAKISDRKDFYEFLESEKIILPPDKFFFNSGCWSIPSQHFYDLVELWVHYIDHYYNQYASVKNDQYFLAPAAYNLGLQPDFLTEYVEADDRHMFHDSTKGFDHIYGEWRAHKHSWQDLLKKTGIESRLQVLSKARLSRPEYKVFWRALFDEDESSGKSKQSYLIKNYRYWKFNRMKGIKYWRSVMKRVILQLVKILKNYKKRLLASSIYLTGVAFLKYPGNRLIYYQAKKKQDLYISFPPKKRNFRIFDYDYSFLPNEYIATLEAETDNLDFAKGKTGLSIGYPAWNLLYYSLLCSLPTDGRNVVVLETGTNMGISTIIMAQALKDLDVPGIVHTVDIDDENINLAKQNVERAGLSEYVHFNNQNSISFLADFVEQKDYIDFAFLDSNHEFQHVWDEFSIIYPLIVASKGKVYFDNSTHRGVSKFLNILRKAYGGNIIEFVSCSWGSPGNALWNP